jgi:diaminohydroxyphosphoribosylaminopyrimidine deaminase/5-amino-6-(5-phosphoribosylamino)uracil reductase
MNRQELYMQRCLELAAWGRGTAAPNPLVGAVLVYDDRIIGEGYHVAFGLSHAEVNAVESVASEQQELIKKATLYVNLEPCNHKGKTPPCTDLIIDHEIPKVVIGKKDPHPKVRGKGIEILEEAGIEVKTGVLSEQCYELNKRFYRFHQQKRPYIVLKWAQTEDGYLAKPDKTPVSITQRYSQNLVHKWRGEEHSIMVGSGTVKHDDPRLTVRHWNGPEPLRIVVDQAGALTEDYRIFKGKETKWVFTHGKKQCSSDIKYFSLVQGEPVIQQVCKTLYENDILSVFVEGGQRLLTSFIEAGLWDEARVFTGRKILKNGVEAPYLRGRLAGHYHVPPGDVLNIYKPVS